jgi:hypothetical protein
VMMMYSIVLMDACLYTCSRDGYCLLFQGVARLCM